VTEQVEAVRNVLASGSIAGQGPRGHALEERFAEVTDRTHAVAVSNCTAALHLSLLAFGADHSAQVGVAGGREHSECRMHIGSSVASGFSTDRDRPVCTEVKTTPQRSGPAGPRPRLHAGDHKLRR
jgi:hypothetical protein